MSTVRSWEGEGGKRFRLGYILAFLAFLYVPILLLPLFSFNDALYVTLPLKGFTTKWYGQLLANKVLHQTLWNSLEVALAASLISTALGVFAAKAFTRYKFRGQGLTYGMVMLAMILPEVLVGISLLLCLNALGIPLGLHAVLFGHVLFCLPFAVSVLMSRLEGFDKSLEEASLDLGENGWMTFWRVTFPLILPAVVSSLLLTFTISFDEFILAFFLSSTETTMPVYIWGQLRFPQKLPEVLALGTFIIVVSTALVVVSQMVRGEELTHAR